jgi:mycoredoxin
MDGSVPPMPAATVPVGRGEGQCPCAVFHPMMDAPDHPEIVVYWRPGCPFCSLLLRQLRRRGVPHQRVDIWKDLDGAARVREVAAGNETVPTVVVGPVALVNPDVHAVLAAAAHHVPDAVPSGYEPPQPGRVGRWLRSVVGIGARSDPPAN